MRFHARKQFIPDQIEHGLYIFNPARNCDDFILVGHHDAILSESAVAPVGIVPTAPELKTVALVPITFRITAVRRLLRSRHRDPFGWEQLFAIPTTLLQVDLTQPRDVFRANAQPIAAERDALKI